MLIETTRFGRIEVDGDKLITFKGGILGFPDLKKYALIQTSPDPVFFWLQSVESPSLVPAGILNRSTVARNAASSRLRASSRA